MSECAICGDALALAMSTAPKIHVSPTIDVVRCPRCGSLVLDDWLGWKGSGVVFRGSVDAILDYVAKAGVPPLSPEILAAISMSPPDTPRPGDEKG